jgi:hypothetical protein
LRLCTDHLPWDLDGVGSLVVEEVVQGPP